MSVKVSDDSAALLKGVNTLANAVKSTLGAKGRTLLIERGQRAVHPTKDGVTVARSIELSDPIENLSCTMLKSAAIRTAEEAGDGTTTTTVLAQKLYSEALGYINDGAEPVSLKEGLEKAASEVVKFIEGKAILIEEDLSQLKSIATISANNDSELGDLISEAFSKVGKEGVISYTDSPTSKSFIEFKEGVSFDSGYWSPHFVTDVSKSEAKHSNPKILIIDGDLEVPEPIVHIIEECVQNNKPLVIVAHKLSVNLLQTLALNHTKTPANLLAIRAPYSGDNRKEFLEDLAVITGANLVSDPSGAGFRDYTYEMLGSCDKIISRRTSTEVIGGMGSVQEIAERVEALKTLLTNTTDKEESAFIKSRISKLNGGVAILNIGANTQVELAEKMDRVEDALEATRSALEEGIVVGGGITLLRAAHHLKNQTVDKKDQLGYTVMTKALEEPFLQLLINAGIEDDELSILFGSVAVDPKFGYNTGYDVKDYSIGNLMEKGIIDPAKVCRIAVEASTSVVGILINTSYTITQERE